MSQKKCVRLLYKMCGRHALLPKGLQIQVQYDHAGNALYRGGFADVWRGKHRGCDVAVKVLRTYSDHDLKKIIGVSHFIVLFPPVGALTALFTEVL